jgi:DNA-binding LytR/AlgR family response regulator
MAKCAINGYEVEALAFLLKPVKYADFARAIRKALRLSDSATHCIIVKTGGGLKKIQTTDITFLEVRNNTVYINTENKEVIPVRMTLTELEKQIGGGAFVRCNNCYLVNLRYVTDVIGDTVKVNGSELVISRHRKKPFLDALTLYYGRR